MLSQLSYWPWIVGAAAPFFLTLRFGYDGALGMTPIGLAVFSGAVAACVIGLTEAASSGVMLGEGASGFAELFAGLAITSIPGSAVAMLLAGILLRNKDR